MTTRPDPANMPHRREQIIQVNEIAEIAIDQGVANGDIKRDRHIVFGELPYLATLSGQPALPKPLHGQFSHALEADFRHIKNTTNERGLRYFTFDPVMREGSNVQASLEAIVKGTAEVASKERRESCFTLMGFLATRLTEQVQAREEFGGIIPRHLVRQLLDLNLSVDERRAFNRFIKISPTFHPLSSDDGRIIIPDIFSGDPHEVEEAPKLDINGLIENHLTAALSARGEDLVDDFLSTVRDEGVYVRNDQIGELERKLREARRASRNTVVKNTNLEEKLQRAGFTSKSRGSLPRIID